MEDSAEVIEAGDDVAVPENFVDEAGELLALVSQVVNTEGRDACRIFERYKLILSKYQEQSQLLDAYLEDIVSPLSNILRSNARLDAANSMSTVIWVCRMLNILVMVRGYKTVVKFLPHEAADLEQVLSLLKQVNSAVPGTLDLGDTDASLAIWETQSILLLWLSILIIMPFELSTLDSTAIDASSIRSQPYTALVADTLLLCKEYIRHPGSCRVMAALLLGRLLTRPDMEAALLEYVAWAKEALVTDVADVFLVPGVLQSLCHIYKLGSRPLLLRLAPSAAALVSALTGRMQGAMGVLARKLAVTLTGRIMLAFMPPRLAPWRYVHAAASLHANLTSEGLAELVTAEPEPEEEEELEVAEEVEEGIGQLLEALRDRDTLVRWSAAKALGRVAGCLPQALGEEVVNAARGLLRPQESDTAWHGGCLALAELARRGLLLPSTLPSLMPVIIEALRYDVRRGAHSVGAHVRDAACYVVWSISRSYESSLLSGVMTGLACALLPAATYDREVHVRRAAAAAFQEAVGRTGCVPHGLDILHVADYFAVGNLFQAYTRVAPFVAAYPEYTSSLMNVLLKEKTVHWEKSLRELAARALALLVPHAAAELSTTVLDQLLPRCLDPVLEIRHGSTCAVAELLPAFHANGVALTAERVSKVAGLVAAIDKARLYRGRGGEIMREAVSKLIASLSRVNLPLEAQQLAKVKEALEENLKHPSAFIQKAAVHAFAQYARTYVVQPDAVKEFEKRIARFATACHDPNVAVRRGAAAALGVLPRNLLEPVADQVIDALIGCTCVEEEPDDRDVESRVSAVKSLGEVSTTLYGSQADSVEPDAAGVKVLLEKIIPALSASLNDYATDSRGDVGSWVREAAMRVMLEVVRVIQSRLPQDQLQEVMPGLAVLLLSHLLKQGVERIARIRETALYLAREAASDKSLSPFIPTCHILLAQLPNLSGEEEAPAMQDSLEKIAVLLHAEEYRSSILEGLVASIGCVDEHLARSATNALVSQVQPRAERHFRDLQSSAASTEVASCSTSKMADGRSEATGGIPSLVPQIVGDLINLWGVHAKSSRMSVPLLRTADSLITQCPATLSLRIPETGSSSGTPGSKSFADVLVGLTRAEIKGASDVIRLTWSSSLLAHIVDACLSEMEAGEEGQLSCSSVTVASADGTVSSSGSRWGSACESALQGILGLLMSRFPKIRRHSAEQLYLALLGAAEGDGALSLTCADASEILLSTSWDGAADDARTARDRLAEVLGVAPPKIVARAGGADRSNKQDENESYQALLDDSARGYN